MPETPKAYFDDLRAKTFLRGDYNNEYFGLVLILGRDDLAPDAIWEKADKHPIVTFGEYLAAKDLHYEFSEAMQPKLMRSMRPPVQRIRQE